ncbi:aldehyde dehydrogenase family protein [Candidatus Gottesmanbacteria bacterium]|nr:aldehyde dehydrogenase family protein [Candidatus Gottesmanbacteria bacterium]
MIKLISTNPAHNYRPIGSVSVSTTEEIKQKVTLAQKAKSKWKEIGVARRVGYIREIYNKLMEKKEEIIQLVTSETGKCLKDARSEVDRYGKNFQWFIENVETSLQDEVTYEDDKTIHKIIYEPLGVAAVIIPWNHPFGMFVWGVIPNLLAGNTVVFKHSEECPLTGKFIEEIINSTSLPKGVFSEVYGNGKVGRLLIRQNINLIWFTGSSAAGKEIYKDAAQKFIKVVLEMGGSNPGIVFEDADVDRFIDKLYAKRFLTCGQTCDALKRLIVHESLFDEVVEKMKTKVEEKKVGNPNDESTDIGSLVAKRQVDLLDSQVKDAIRKGATVITGGSKPKDLQGAYYLPTILTRVKKT